MIGADIGGRALAPDVLLARGQGQTKGAPAVAIAGLTDQAPGHLPQMGRSGGQKAHARTAVLQRQPKALAFAHRDIDADLSGALSRPSASGSAVTLIESAPARWAIAEIASSGSTIPNMLG